MAADTKDSAQEKERQLVSKLASDAPPGDKALACKQLAIYGTDAAVPALAALLTNEELSSWARIALEAIPGAAADVALREALPKLQGRLLVGTINSIGVRGDALAVTLLLPRLKDTDTDVASATAVALGRIGGPRAAKALKTALDKAPDEVRPAVAEGCIRCAEKMVAQQKVRDACKLYQAVRVAHVPRQKVLEATRGAILAQKTAGIPLLLQTLRAKDKATFGFGLRTARELPGKEVTKALTAELWWCSRERQPLLLMALADQGSGEALPTVVEAVNRGSKQLRATAVAILQREGDVSCIPVLLDAAVNADEDLAPLAQGALAKLGGSDVDADLLRRLPPSTSKMRQVLIDISVQRGLDGAMPAILQSANDEDNSMRRTAIHALGAMGGAAQVPTLIAALNRTQDEVERRNMEAALLAVCGRSGAASAQEVIPLTQCGDGGLRIIGLHALAAAGGPQALATVKAALDDKDESVQDEAVRTLSTWPNTWPEDEAVAEPLLALAKSGRRTTHQVLALRGYLQFVQGDKKLPDSEKAAKVSAIMPLLTRPEERRLAIGTLQHLRDPEALKLLAQFLGEPSVAEDACSAIYESATKGKAKLPADDRKKALELVAQHSSNDSLKQKAREAMEK
jgi:HEAT repeat protein